jgi:hypothetical protein
MNAFSKATQMSGVYAHVLFSASNSGTLASTIARMDGKDKIWHNFRQKEVRHNDGHGEPLFV